MRKIYLLMSAMLILGASSSSFGQGVDCASATPISPGVTTSPGIITPGGGIDMPGGNADWYSFVPDCDGTIDMSACGDPAMQDTRLFVYEGACPSASFEAIASDDDFCGSTSWSSAVFAVPVTAGETYYFEWDDSWSNHSPQFELTYNPTGITGISSIDGFTDADLSWTPVGGESSWDIEYGPTGFTPGTGTTVTSFATTYTLTGLTEGTTFDVYITPDVGCPVPGTYSFTTQVLCAVPVAPNVTGITTEDATLNWSAGGAEVLWDISWGTMGTLIGAGTSVDETGVTSEILAGLTADTDYEWYVRAVCDLNLLDGVDTVSLWIGPNDFTTSPNCADPSALGATPDDFEADLDWTANGGETEWNIEWGATGFTLGSGTTEAGVITNPYTLNGLLPGMSYDYYVQAVCGSTPDSLSGFVGPFTFTTNVFCDAPAGFGITYLDADSVIIDWADGTGSEWELEYGVSGFTPGTGTTNSRMTSNDTIAGLSAGTEYCYYVRSVCGTGADSSSVWMGPMCFTTNVICPAPASLNAITITTTAANLIWGGTGVENNWNVEWGLPGFTEDAGEEVGFVDNTVDNPYYATGLLESTPYWYYVQAECGSTADSISDWAGPFLFGTELINDEPCDAIVITVDDPQRQFHNFGGTTDVGEGAVAPPFDGADCGSYTSWCADGVIDQSVWFSFVAPASGAVSVSTFDEELTMTSNHTEIAIYGTPDCSNYGTYTLEGANTVAADGGGAGFAPYGSEVTMCALTPGETYYVVVDPVNFIENDITFGIEITTVDAAPEAGTPVNLEACEGTPVDFFTTITGNSGIDGTWYNPIAVSGNEIPSAVTGLSAGSYSLVYVLGNACASDTVETILSVIEAPSAGADGTFTTCNTFDVILIEHLVGSIDMGGTWSDDDATDALFGGLFVSYGIDPGTYSFTYTVDGNGICPDESSTVEVTLTQCLGTGENGLETLSVYPNPVVDVLTIQNLSIENNGTIELIDAQGKLVNATTVSGIFGNYELDMTNLESGVYFVNIVTETSTQQVRVVKK